MIYEVRIHGRGGQGVVAAAELLAAAAFAEGWHAQAFPSSERTGAPVVSFRRISDGPIRLREPVTHPDALALPAQEQVDRFLPGYEPRQVLDPADPVSIGAMVGPEAFTEVRYLAHQRQGRALEPIPRIAAGFAAAFGRESGGSTGLGGTGLELRRARREKARS